MGPKSHLCSKYFLKAMFKISLALWGPGKLRAYSSDSTWDGVLVALSSFPPPGWSTLSVQYVQCCLAAASSLTEVSSTCELASGGLGPWNTVWVEFSTRCLVWPGPRVVLPVLQTPLRSQSSRDGKYSSCCCERTLIFHYKPSGMSLGQTKVSRSQIFSLRRTCLQWMVFLLIKVFRVVPWARFTHLKMRNS